MCTIPIKLESPNQTSPENRKKVRDVWFHSICKNSLHKRCYQVYCKNSEMQSTGSRLKHLGSCQKNAKQRVSNALIFPMDNKLIQLPGRTTYYMLHCYRCRIAPSKNRQNRISPVSVSRNAWGDRSLPNLLINANCSEWSSACPWPYQSYLMWMIILFRKLLCSGKCSNSSSLVTHA